MMPIKTSRAESVFSIVALLILTGGPLTVLVGGQADDVEGKPVATLLILLIYLVTVALLAVHWKQALYIATRDMLVWAFIGMVFISVLQSDNPGLSLWRSFALLGTTLFGVYLATCYDVRTQLRLLAWVVGLAAVSSALLAVAVPTSGISAAGWEGMFVTKNVLGRMMVLGAVVFLLVFQVYQRWRWLSAVGFGLSVGLVLLSTSKTALAVLLLLLVLAPCVRIVKWPTIVAIPTGILLLTISAMTVLISSNNLKFLLNLMGRDATLTGRTVLWSAAVDMIRKQPWLGYGYQGFWLGWQGPSAYIWAVTGWNPPHAHNGFLDFTLDIGVVGLLVFLLGFARAFCRAAAWGRSSNTAEYGLPLLFFIFLILYDVSESTIAGRNSIFWAMYVTFALSVGSRRTVTDQLPVRRPRNAPLFPFAREDPSLSWRSPVATQASSAAMAANRMRDAGSLKEGTRRARHGDGKRPIATAARSSRRG